MSILQMRNIVKRYPGTIALDDVTMSFESGKVHAFIGSNGSGKSTMMKIIAGAETQTSGDLLLDGESIGVGTPQERLEIGIATVYQELSLAPNMTVEENLFFGRYPMKGLRIDWKKVRFCSVTLLKEMKVDVKPWELIRNLPLYKCQMIEIVKAMSGEPKILLLDEPTSALVDAEAQLLFDMIRNLMAKKDVVVIFITHRLKEIWEIADSCTVLRDGKLIGVREVKDMTHSELIDMMFGDVQHNKRPDDLPKSDEVVMKVENFSRGKYFRNVNLELRRGEVLGIAGMLGSGRTELLKAIFGADDRDEGNLYLNGVKVEKVTPITMKKLGVGLTPEERKTEGLVQMLSVKKNLCLAGLWKKCPSIRVKRSTEAACVERQIKSLRIKTPNPDVLVSSLSGGNQQKVVIGGWLNTEPTIMMYDEPSRGIDVNAKQQIFEIIWEGARNGISSLVVSSELEELLEVCQRVLIMYHGEIIEEANVDDLTLETLYAKCMGEPVNAN